jgi:hypothetical protein
MIPATVHDPVVGWDVGGANLKAVRLEPGGLARTAELPFELWRAADALPAALRHVLDELGAAPLHAVTMTAELADCFRTKRQGVTAVIDAVEEVLGEDGVRVYSVRGELLPAERARRSAFSVAGANWHAAAGGLARRGEAGILVDVGSTTTDVVPFGPEGVRARGSTDPQRLLEGELVYTGAQRTPLCAIVRTVPLRGRECPVAAEHFAIAADAHVWLGALPESGYRCATPDGGPATRDGAAARLARTVAADVEMLEPGDLTAIAERAASVQVAMITQALARIAARLTPELPLWSEEGEGAPRDPRPLTTTDAMHVWIAGSGAWLGEAAARRCGLPATRLDDRLGDAARVLPALGVATLLAEAAGSPAIRGATGDGAGASAARLGGAGVPA